MGCDVVLGAQWLSSLVPIMWDFSKLQMRFTKGRDVMLKGLTPPENKLVNAQEIKRELKKKKGGALLQICSLSMSICQPHVQDEYHSTEIDAPKLNTSLPKLFDFHRFLINTSKQHNLYGYVFGYSFKPEHCDDSSQLK
ncbi:hypothetical protein Ddye_024918 [Dipteronia dyeriana]|uniref:Uncharacterized protein n=1 Tax=Dipteronia dyeriana TaxID=168575 RepID=A0AAD9WUX1_9ROSI|nr:hypothetical protein Ddye_024918 [Dipteronia dyeriana]